MYKIIISYIIASALALGLLNHAVNKAQDNIETLAEVLVHHADHYHADYCNPYWASSLKKTCVIGKHIFYK